MCQIRKFFNEIFKLISIKVYGCISMFFCHFYKGKQLLWLAVCSLDNKTFLIQDLLLRNEFAPKGANSFLKSRSQLRRGKKEIGRVASPENVPIYLNSNVVAPHSNHLGKAVLIRGQRFCFTLKANENKNFPRTIMKHSHSPESSHNSKFQ